MTLLVLYLVTLATFQASLDATTLAKASLTHRR